jgi:hypothetical protein
MSRRNPRVDLANIEEWSLSDVALASADQTDQGRKTEGQAELSRRLTKAQMDAAFWMKWSVVVIALTGLVQLATWLWPRH